MNGFFKDFFTRRQALVAPQSSAPETLIAPCESPRAHPGLTVYLAGRYARRDELRAIAKELTELGHRVTSRWLFVDASIPGGMLAPDGRAAEIATMDFEDVREADVCIAFTEPQDGPQGRGGRHTELGIALALGQRVLIVGPREHVFHCLSDVERYEQWSEARDHLLGRPAPRRELTAA